MTLVLNAADKQLVQEIIGTFLFYARAINVPCSKILAHFPHNNRN
jgi:hypothetical protein